MNQLLTEVSISSGKKVILEKHKNAKHGALSSLGQGQLFFSYSAKEGKERDANLMKQIWKEKPEAKTGASAGESKEKREKPVNIMQKIMIVIWSMTKTSSRS